MKKINSITGSFLVILFLCTGFLYAQNYIPNDSSKTDTTDTYKTKPDKTKIDTSHMDMRRDTLIYNNFGKYNNYAFDQNLSSKINTMDSVRTDTSGTDTIQIMKDTVSAVDNRIFNYCSKEKYIAASLFSFNRLTELSFADRELYFL